MSTMHRLRDLEQAATPGPWVPCVRDFGDPDCTGLAPSLCMGHDYDWYGQMSPEDRALIAESRNTLPALLDVAEAARGARATLAGLSAVSEVAAILDALDRLEAADLDALDDEDDE